MIVLDEMMIGNEFGWLTVIELADSKYGRKRYRCKCRCGKEVIKIGTYLRSGQTKSCGCLQFSLDGSVGPLLEHLEKSLSVEKNTSVYCLIQKGRSNSGVKGVSFERKRGKWKAYLAFKGKKYQKRFDTKEEAIRYREELEKELFLPVIEKACQMGVLNGNYQS